MIVHPAYDPSAREWFTDCGLAAPTLSALQELLEPGARILGYKPSGFNGAIDIKITGRGYARAKGRRPANNYLFPRRPRGSPKEYERAPKYDRALILKLWYEGKQQPEIAKEIGCHPSTAYEAIRAERIRANPLAVIRRPVRHVQPRSWTSHEIQTLKSMLEQGASYLTAANALGFSRSAVAGKIGRLGLRRKAAAAVEAAA